MISIVPAIDLIDGKCVRLRQGCFDSSVVYSNDPLAAAKRFEDAGLTRLHMVDLDGAKIGHVVNDKILAAVAGATQLQIDFGGGIASDDDLERVFESGAQQVTVGSTAVRKPELFERWLEHYGTDKFILAADVRDGQVLVRGWQDGSGRELLSYLEEQLAKGVKTVMCTDVSCDGELAGPAFELYSSVLLRFPDLELIASGGVSSLDDIRRLDGMGIESVIVGKALYEGYITLEDLRGIESRG